MKYTCPACGYLTFENPPGSDEICPICFWHDDLTQLVFPQEKGANRVSLLDAQKNFADFCAVEKDMIPYVKKMNDLYAHDKKWRKIDLKRDKFGDGKPSKNYLERYNNSNYPHDLTELYYWSGNYWKKQL